MVKHPTEKFLHFATCMQRLNNAWQTLSSIKESSDNPLAGPAFRFALVEYSIPYTRSDAPSQERYRLDESYVPPEFIDLHRRILIARDTFHAHADLTVLKAKMSIFKTKGIPSAIIETKDIDGLQEFSNIDQIISLIEGTLQNMYSAQEQFLSDLQ